jgi:hypothetical protein
LNKYLAAMLEGEGSLGFIHATVADAAKRGKRVQTYFFCGIKAATVSIRWCCHHIKHFLR